MLEKNKVLKFKLNETYKKAVYKLPEQKEEHLLKFENKEKPAEEYTLEKDGFVIVKNEVRAKILSEELREKIKSAEIRGTRAFTGEFFIIYNDLLQAAQNKVLCDIKQSKTSQVGSIAERVGLIPTIVVIASEFLKEEGQIIEKKKGTYQYIE